MGIWGASRDLSNGEQIPARYQQISVEARLAG
jgi:hypothetical protein